ncbi:MAG: hypothetical protein E5X05_01180 [Mesorhizobium sp.]|nr:MAG: hypothetical protein E5X05_01180 [Mesorhizobium sp.]
MSDMIERVSAAIYQSLMGMREISTDTLARAAIEAMREPTEEMVEAGVRSEWGGTLGSRVANSYRDMVSIALSQDTLQSSSSAEPPRVADAQAGEVIDPLTVASPAASITSGAE